MSIQHLRVPPEQLTKVCDPDDLGFETTDEIAPLEGTIGQERAISALEMALDIEQPGFNLFISGPPGTGRNTALRSYVDRIAANKPRPADWGYVHNFQDQSQPIAITLPCGMVKGLCRDMDELIDTCRREIPRAFESDDYTNRIAEVVKEIQDRRQVMTEEMERVARAAGLTIRSTPAGLTPVPLREGRPMTQEEFASLPEGERDHLTKGTDDIQHVLTRTTADIRRLNKDAVEQSGQVDKDVVLFTLTPIVNELQEKYAEYPELVSYLDQVEADMVDNLDVFKPKEEAPPQMPGLSDGNREEEVLVRYRVNDLVDNEACLAAPVVFEHSPTYYNLFGRIDYRARMGAFNTDFMMIKPGSLHRANGGYLVVQARDLLAAPMSWDTLKRTLRSGELRIENIGEQYSPLPSATMRPEPIPVNTKVIVVGTPDVLQMLRAVDEDFRRYFKVTADFDWLMDRTPENMRKYAAFVAARVRDSGLRPFDKTAVAGVIDYSSRLVEDQNKLTTKFLDVADIITEANYWAGAGKRDAVTHEDVHKAIDQRKYRASLTEERMQEFIEEGTIHIATDGSAVGQVNGLAVLSLGEHQFGKPSRITARASLGRGQLVNVERETKMSGRIHDKGFMILTGYLQGKYGRDKPLSLSASIGFEQTYSEVDGDSASSTELYALLSELSGLPISQGTAVTGSVNQNGEVQAIGGAIYKIEGFFDLCKARGLDRKQGAMVPRDNLKNLVLKDEVVQAVLDGLFHIYGVSTIDEGIEVLTGVPAGEAGEDGLYPDGTVHQLVEKRLQEMARVARDFAKADEDDRRISEDESA